MLDAIRYWQENDKGGLEEDVKAIDSAITFIACEHDAPGVLSEKESLSLIAALSFYEKNAAKDRKRAKYGDRSLKKAFR